MTSSQLYADILTSLESRVIAAGERRIENRRNKIAFHEKAEQFVPENLAEEIERLTPRLTPAGVPYLMEVLPGRPLSDNGWRDTHFDTLGAAGHALELDDCPESDAVMCGEPFEFKLARYLVRSGRSSLMISITNEGSHQGVMSSTLIPDTASLEKSRVLVLDELAAAKFTRKYKTRGWQLQASIEELNDPMGLGEYVMSLGEYAEMLLKNCRCGNMA